MIKIIFLLAICILLIPFAIAGADNNWLDNEELIIEQDITSSIEIVKESSNALIDTVNVELLLFPKNTVNHEIITLDITPEADKQDDYISYTWKKPSDEKLDFGVKSRLNIKNKRVKVTTKTSYPLTGLPDDIKKYTVPTKTIDSDNQEVISLASNLAEGEDDLYILTHKIGSWVKNNIEYSLDTLTAEAVQKPSWVLTSKYGVCDELTALFIAMMRSLGVPARYISGVAYTNWENLNDFGAHAWAEVYYPNIGWIPYDVTYGQIGFLDPTHIALKISEDSESSSTKFEWKGRYVDLKTKKLDIKTRVVGAIGIKSPDISLDISLLKEKVKRGSRNIIIATVENLRDYYVTTEIRLAKTNEITVEGNLEEQIVLAPKEKKKLAWIIKLSDSLNPDFIYTFPVEVYSISNESAKSEFTSSMKDPYYSKEDIEEELEVIKATSERKFTPLIDLRCTSDGEIYYIDEVANITCRITNIGNKILNDVNICLSKDCKSASILLSQAEAVSFSKSFEETGKKEHLITAKNNEINQPFYLNLEILERPEIKFMEISFPEKVAYNEIFEVNFGLERISLPNNVTVRFISSNDGQEWAIGELNNNRDFNIEMSGNNLNIGPNELKIETEFYDIRDNMHYIEKKFNIELVDVTLFQRLSIYLRDIGIWLEKIIDMSRTTGQ